MVGDRAEEMRNRAKGLSEMASRAVEERGAQAMNITNCIHFASSRTKYEAQTSS